MVNFVLVDTDILTRLQATWGKRRKKSRLVTGKGCSEPKTPRPHTQPLGCKKMAMKRNSRLEFQ